MVGKYVIKNVMFKLIAEGYRTCLAQGPEFHPQYHRKTKPNVMPCEYHFGKLTVLGGAVTDPMLCGGGRGVGIMDKPLMIHDCQELVVSLSLVP